MMLVRPFHIINICYDLGSYLSDTFDAAKGMSGSQSDCQTAYDSLAMKKMFISSQMLFRSILFIACISV